MEVLNGFAAALQPLNILLIFGGTALGVLVGALPGLSSPMAIIVLLPLTFGMEPLPALLAMVGVYVGTKLGGSFSAILLRTPGTPAGACTALDGYPLAQRGEAGRALGLATMGSTLGGIFGWLIAIIFVPLLATIAVKSTNADIALVGVLGLVMVSAFVRGSTLKGLIGVILGLLIATVGLDPMAAVPRFTFGSVGLLEGVSFAAALIGFFGIAVVLADMPLIGSKSFLTADKVSVQMPKFGELLRRWKSIAIGAVYGTGVGAIPGVGAEGATWLAYATARNISPEKEQFGTGHPDGILAPEATNNAVTGGTMLPMLTLGIPGDGSTAVMLGALVLHGIQPGVLLMRDESTLVYGILAGMLIATIFMALIGWTAIRAFIYVLTKDRSWLFPFVLVFATIGAFASSNAMFPVYVALFFGVVGFCLERFGFPIVTVVLGIILGPIIEYNARVALAVSGGEWSTFIDAPHRMGLVIALVALMVWEVIQHRKQVKQAKVTQPIN